MNGIKRMSLMVGMLLAVMGVFSNVAFAQSESNSSPAEVAASFDQKYFLPDYIAYSGIESVAQRALTLRAAAAFDGNFLTPGSIVDTLNGDLDSTVVQVGHRQTMASVDAQHEFDYAAALAADAARWQATADHYARTLIVDDFDYAEAAAVQAARWQAMADFYVQNDLLVDNFNYAEAEAVQAARWQAMADYYAQNDLLIDNFDYAEAEAVQAARWQAIADYYAQHGPFIIDNGALAEVATGR